jgi:peptide deformylase
VRAQNLSGDFFEIEARDLLAVCLQHEIDHLIGKVFVQYLPYLKQEKIKAKLKKDAKKQK